MRCTLLYFLEIISISLAVSYGQDANFRPLASFNPDFNPNGVQPDAAIAQQSTFPQFSPSQEQIPGSGFPGQFNAYQAQGAIDRNPNAVPQVAQVQNPAFPQASFFGLPQEQAARSVLPQTFNADPSASDSNTGKSHFTDVVRTFATNFVQKIQASPVYRKAFSLHSVSREEATKLFKDYIYTANQDNGDTDPEFSSYTVSQAVRNNYESTTSQRLIEIHAYAAAELLYQTGLLTAENSLKLSNEYYQDTANSIDAVTVDAPAEKLKAALTGFQNFLTDNQVYKNLAFVVSSVFYQVYYTLNNS